MLTSILSITDFATKLVAGFSGLIVAIAIVCIVMYATHKKSK